MKVFVFGHYHTSNFGDRLLRDLMISSIKAAGVTDVLSIDESKWTNMGSIQRIAFLIRMSVSADKFILGGGGYINSDGGNSIKLLRFVIPILLRVLLRKSYIVVGVGIGPELNFFARFYLMIIAKYALLFSVRDEASAKIANEVLRYTKCIVVRADNALITPFPSKVNSIPNLIPRVIFHLMLRSNEREVVTGIRNIIERFGTSVKFELLADNKLCGVEKEGLDDLLSVGVLRIRENLSNEEVLSELASAAFVVTTKLHVGILSYVFDVPVISLARHGKTCRFYEQIGKKTNCFDIRNLNDKCWQDISLEIKKVLPKDDSYYDEQVRRSLILAAKQDYKDVLSYLGREN